MELFDKKYVYFMWDDELEGKRCFTGNDVNKLVDYVNNNDNLAIDTINKGNSEYPFSAFCTPVRFVYYDPNYNIKRAWRNKRQLQIQLYSNGDWTDTDYDNLEDLEKDLYQYTLRIKPEETEKKYRPFKDCDELIEIFQKKIEKETELNNIVYPVLYKPLIWVRNKEFKTTHLITSFGEIKATNIQVVEISNMNFTMKELFDSFEFLNSSPCGVEE